MNRRYLLLLAGLMVFCGAVGLFVFTRPAPKPVAETAAAAPPPAPRPAPAPPPEPVAPAVPAAPEPRRRAAAPAPSAPPAEAAPAAPTTGTLHIDSDVPGAQVFLDRQYVGDTPATASDVVPGSHTLNVSAKGYESIGSTIDVAPGSRDISVTFREVRLDAKLQVVHKHRMGSCTGSLIATPQGLRYDTANKDDAFTVGMNDLEAFEINYLQKNLKIKIRKGKQYDFTDPDGNADRLFVFHRDVDKARDRLKKGDRPAAQ